MVYEAQYDFSGKSITFGVKKAFKLQKWYTYLVKY
jgi:hypothetical protein